jgi:putative ABC transport system permease protein
MNDFKLAIRQLQKNPAFTAVAVLTLALGIGANTAMFSFVNAILLRPLSYREPERLVMLLENYPANGWSKLNPAAPVFEEWRKQGTVFEGLAAARTFGSLALTGKGRPEVLTSSAISASLFPLLEIQPLLGRGFLPEDEVVGKDNTVLLSYELWQNRFGGDPNIIGQSLTLDMDSRTVVGVMPRDTMGPEGRRDLWTPLAFEPYELTESRAHNFPVIGRLKDGVTLQQARQEMDLISRRMAEADPRNRGWGAEVYPLHDMVVGDSWRLLVVLLGAVGLVLLIACANIASLLLARSAGRTHEFAIRAALGARRSDMMRQLLTESCLLAGLGGMLGVLLAGFALNALVRFSPPDLPRLSEGIQLDAATLAFTILVTLATGVLFGLLPALQASNPALAHELAETGRGGSPGRARQLARSVLVVAEIALSLMLLIGAGLTLRSFGKLLAQNLGYTTEHVVTMSITLPGQRYPDQNGRAHFFDSLLAAVTNIAGVESAGLAFGAPLTGINSRRTVLVHDAPPPPTGETLLAGYAQVSSGYFSAMKIALVQGRTFNEHDDTNALPAAVVDETFVREFSLGDRVLGRRVDIGDGTQNTEIIGVVKAIKRVGVAEEPRGELYRPYRQVCWGILTLVVRTPRNPADLTRAIRAELDRIDRDIPLDSVSTMSQLVSANIAQRRLSAELLGAFAGGALLLSALGLYGVLAYLVTQRTREIGIRVALGAQPRQVLGLVVGQGMKLALLGAGLGLLGSLALVRVLTRLLFEIDPLDPTTFFSVPLLLLAIAALACYLPARRATKVHPIEALRHE